MKIYCVTEYDFTIDQLNVVLVCSKEIAVVNLALEYARNNQLGKLYCRVYDDVGVQIDEGYLYKTAELRKVDLSI